MNVHILTFDTIGSTNTEALDQARRGAPEGLCIVAREQTAGRGRYGRVWASDIDAGLNFSVILRPRLQPDLLPLITLMAGVAVSDTLREFGLEPDIKWVNDVLVDGRKISGILAETAETPDGTAAIVGIGINIRSSNYPPEIADKATSIEAASPNANGSGPSVPSPEQLAQVLSNYLAHYYQILGTDDGPQKILSEWRARSSYFSGRPVRVTLENTTLEGVTDGLESNGALRLRNSDGQIVVVQAGDVELLRTTAVEQ